MKQTRQIVILYKKLVMSCNSLKKCDFWNWNWREEKKKKWVKIKLGGMQREENNINVLTHQHTDLLHTWLAIIHIWIPWDIACILFLHRPTIKNCMLSTLMQFFQLIRRNNKAKLQISYFYPSLGISYYYLWVGRQMCFFISTNDSGIRTLQMKAFPVLVYCAVFKALV